MKLILAYSFLILTLSYTAQTEIKLVYDTADVFKDQEKLNFGFLEGSCSHRATEVVLLNSQEEMHAFTSHYKERTTACYEITRKDDFKSQAVLFVGMALGGNQKFDISFCFVSDTLQIVIIVISPENIDYSLVTISKFFLIDKKYLQNIPICTIRNKIIK